MATKDAWKDDIRNYYRNSANQNVEESDKQYLKSLSQLNNTMLSRGMQRSSYGIATGANIQKGMAEAANKIRTNAENEANMAIINQQNTIDALEWEKEQAKQAQENWQKQYQLQVDQFNWQKQQAADAAAQATARAAASYTPAANPGTNNETPKPQEEQTAYDRVISRIAELNKRLKSQGKPQIQPYNNMLTGSISVN